MKENDYYQKGYTLGRRRALEQANEDEESRKVSEMLDELMYQPESVRIFSIGFIYGWNDAKRGENDREE